ncbi:MULTISPECIES: ABC transporter permease [unclassified Paenibacillus]|uniref:ABC transporter permease n=1 Tax=unclassified Paenibacillus TaxID=185978 RepID=UPI0003E1D8E1|nr:MULTISPECIES: ABC transporter permease [unclassified Paenibacillus]ETT45534.1 ABC transporter permease [Paenibacillus sp. FSL R7-269]OMF91659.1 ABC transporter [Paenibacillus sp. FSL R7-0337]
MNFIKQVNYVFAMQFNRTKGFLVFFAIIQIMVSVGIVIGFTYLFENPDSNSMLFLATGAPTIILTMTGLVILPQQLATSKVEGYIEFIRTWPVNRASVIVSDTLVWLMITVPGISIATIISQLTFQPGFDFSWTIVPAFLLTALTCIGIGSGFSYALPGNAAMALSQVLAFATLMFSPINFPIDRLPEWLQLTHHVLPIYSMAEVMRSAMAASTFAVDWWHYVNLSIWCVLGYGGAIYILNKK